MPSINFRTTRFNNEVDTAINSLLNIIISPYSELTLVYALEVVYSALHDYYYDKLQDAPEDADDLAKNIFSQLCQDLIYFTVHNIQDLPTRYRISDVLINHPFFMYRTSAGHVTIWIDPKERATALISACRGLTGQHVFVIIKKALAAFTLDPLEFEKFINHREKCGFTALHAGVFDGNFDAISTLLMEIWNLSQNKIVNFENFLTIKSNLSFTPLNTAKKKGFIALARLLAHYGATNCTNFVPPSPSDSPEGSPTEFFKVTNKRFRLDVKGISLEMSMP
jgi:hypothetical protein